jgi:hypothetical protein
MLKNIFFLCKIKLSHWLLFVSKNVAAWRFRFRAGLHHDAAVYHQAAINFTPFDDEGHILILELKKGQIRLKRFFHKGQ